MARGKFITFEGGEGAGKSTQLRLLAGALSRSGVPVCITREPGGSPGAEEIRSLLVTGTEDRWDPLCEALLHFAARADHMRRLILPRLDAGDWVLSDRFADSTMAYQGYAQGLGREPVEVLCALVLKDFAPDLTLVLDLPVETGLARAAEREDGEDRYERLGRTFHERLREAFLDIARREPERCAVIDAGGDLNAVQSAICAAVGERLGISFA